MSSSIIVTAITLVFPAAMIFAGWRDAVSYEVPNWVSICLVIAFALGAASAGMAMPTIAWHFAAGAAVLVAGWALFATGILGGADAKMLAAAAVWTGWSALAEYMFAVGLAGGILAIAIILWRRTALPTRWSGREWLQRLHARESGLPYCVAIGCAGLWIYPRLPLLATVPGAAGTAQ